MHVINKLYPIIIGADQGDLFFRDEKFIAHAITPQGMSVYCVEHPDPAEYGLFHHVNGRLNPVPDDYIIRARRYYIDFNRMHNNEIDARWHAARNLVESNGNDAYRIVQFDEENKTITWNISSTRSRPREVVTPWTHKEQIPVSTSGFLEVEKQCNQNRISVVANSDYGEELYWTAFTPRSALRMHAGTRSRAVIQFCLWELYRRNPGMLISPDTGDWLLMNRGRIDWSTL